MKLNPSEEELIRCVDAPTRMEPSASPEEALQDEHVLNERGVGGWGRLISTSRCTKSPVEPLGDLWVSPDLPSVVLTGIPHRVGNISQDLRQAPPELRRHRHLVGQEVALYGFLVAAALLMGCSEGLTGKFHIRQLLVCLGCDGRSRDSRDKTTEHLLGSLAAAAWSLCEGLHNR